MNPQLVPRFMRSFQMKCLLLITVSQKSELDILKLFSGSLEFLYMDHAKNGMTSRVRPSVCHLILLTLTPVKRDLKIGMHIPHIDGSKATDQYLIFCL